MNGRRSRSATEAAAQGRAEAKGSASVGRSRHPASGDTCASMHGAGERSEGSRTPEATAAPLSPRRTAMNLLARREHSTRELKRKLKVRGMEGVEVDQALAALQEERLLSDERFVEMLVHSRVGKGQGPLRIQAELREHGVSDELVSAAVDIHDPQWYESIKEVRHKRFGASVPSTINERAKQMRFLQYRGFTPEQIRAVFKSRGSDE